MESGLLRQEVATLHRSFTEFRRALSLTRVQLNPSKPPAERGAVKHPKSPSSPAMLTMQIPDQREFPADSPAVESDKWQPTASVHLQL